MDLGKIHTWLYLQISGHRSHLLKSCCGNYWELWPGSWEMFLSWSEGQSCDRTVAIWTVYAGRPGWQPRAGESGACYINKTESDYLWLDLVPVIYSYYPHGRTGVDKKPANSGDKYLSLPACDLLATIEEIRRNIHLPGTYLRELCLLMCRQNDKLLNKSGKDFYVLSLSFPLIYESDGCLDILIINSPQATKTVVPTVTSHPSSPLPTRMALKQSAKGENELKYPKIKNPA